MIPVVHDNILGINQYSGKQEKAYYYKIVKLNSWKGTNIIHMYALRPNFYLDIEVEADTSANKTTLWELLL